MSSADFASGDRETMSAARMLTDAMTGFMSDFSAFSSEVKVKMQAGNGNGARAE